MVYHCPYTTGRGLVLFGIGVQSQQLALLHEGGPLEGVIHISTAHQRVDNVWKPNTHCIQGWGRERGCELYALFVTGIAELWHAPLESCADDMTDVAVHALRPFCSPFRKTEPSIFFLIFSPFSHGSFFKRHYLVFPLKHITAAYQRLCE